MGKSIKKMLLTVVIIPLFLSGCLGYEIVTETEKRIIDKIYSNEYVFIKQDEYSQLKREADLGKNVGRYQLQNSGYRTWRLDTSTGNVCLLLASKEDWKKPEIKAQACFQ